MEWETLAFCIVPAIHLPRLPKEKKGRDLMQHVWNENDGNWHWQSSLIGIEMQLIFQDGGIGAQEI